MISSKKLITAGSIIVLISVVTIYIVSNSVNTDNESLRNDNISADVLSESVEKFEQIENDGVSVSYNSDLSISELTDADNTDGFLMRIVNENPALLVSVKQEKGLRTITTLAKVDMLDLLKSNATKSLPDRYPEYQLLNEEDIEINDKNAYKITFKYKGNNNQIVKQSLILIPRDSDRALYLSYQSAEDSFDNLYTKYFKNIEESIKF